MQFHRTNASRGEYVEYDRQHNTDQCNQVIIVNIGIENFAFRTISHFASHILLMLLQL
jgi:hypothetical protein